MPGLLTEMPNVALPKLEDARTFTIPKTFKLLNVVLARPLEFVVTVTVEVPLLSVPPLRVVTLKLTEMPEMGEPSTAVAITSRGKVAAEVGAMFCALPDAILRVELEPASVV